MNAAVDHFHESTFPIVLSAEDGPYLVKDTKLRELVCLMADVNHTTGELLVSQAHQLAPEVTSYEALLKRNRFMFKRVLVTPREIAARYSETGSGDDNEDYSVEQKRIVGYIIEARSMGAHDISMYINGAWCTIRYIIDGRGYNIHQIPAKEGLRLANALYHSMLEGTSTSLDIRAEQDGTLKNEYAAQAGVKGARVATRPGPVVGSLKLTMRLRGVNTGKSMRIEDGGYTPEQVDMIYGMTEHQQGVVIFSGPTNSGKSTTLQLALEHVDRREKGQLDIITIEDPIEDEFRGYDPDNRGGGIYHTPLVKDNDDPEDAKKAWPRNIANLMRHAPKIIMPGEIRDFASAVAALDFAMSGHMEWTTFHAFSIEGILLRLDEWGVSRNMILNSQLIVGLINQKLVRRVCTECKVPLASVLNDADEVKRYGLTPKQIERFTTYLNVETAFISGEKPTCKTCKGTGQKGRIIAAEVVVPTEEFMDAFRNGAAIAARRYWIQHMNGLTKLAHVIQHVNAGLVDPRHAEADVETLDRDHVTNMVKV